ncbi:MAG: tRNA threonylcarbamoyladenosine dehydratase [Verrucomicrobiaceae bacterium]
MPLAESHLQRFGGIARLYGRAGLQRLHDAHVCVIGVGGVGSWVVEALARSGVGALTLIDLDDVCVTNINRQLPAMEDTIGRPKVSVLAQRVALINPECRVTEVLQFIGESNAAELLKEPFSFVVDAVDRMSIKSCIIGTCRAKGLPVITIGSAGGRREPTLIKLTDLGLSGHDLLLQQVRRKLRQDHGFPKSTDGKAIMMQVPCVFSIEKPVFAWADGTCSLEEEPGTEAGLRLDCASGFGAATHVTGAFAFAAAAHVVRAVAESDDPGTGLAL